jgi:hypothetical protein
MAKMRDRIKQLEAELETKTSDHKHDLEVYGISANRLRAIANTLPSDSKKREKALIVASVLEQVADGEGYDLDEWIDSEIE